MRSIRDMLPLPWVDRDPVWEQGAHTLERVEHEFDYGLEGWLLAHCLGTKDVPQFQEQHVVYSLRDPHGVPHCTVLCAWDRWKSPYGRADDFGVSGPGLLDGKALHLLQIRGRGDRLARKEYHRLIRKWWTDEMGGTIHRPDWWMDAQLMLIQDRDTQYHYSLLLDEKANFFNPEFYERRMAWPINS